MYLCKYRDVFGTPGAGLHSVRIFGLAAVDVLATLVAAFVTARVLRVRFAVALVFILSLGVVAHAALCVDTSLNLLLYSLLGRHAPV